jgi:hypothetical protein
MDKTEASPAFSRLPIYLEAKIKYTEKKNISISSVAIIVTTSFVYKPNLDIN